MEKVEDVTYRLNNMCIVVGDIISSVSRIAENNGARCYDEKSRDDVRLGSIQNGSS